MNSCQRIAKGFKEVYFGKNWTGSDLLTALEDVSLEEAMTKIGELNSIHTLVYHMNYYVREFSKVLRGDPLAAQDLLSFASVSPKDQQEWETMKQQVFEEARAFIPLIESFDEKKLGNLPGDPAWGDYYRNLQGIVEHNHYHLGQIVLIKKLLRSNLLT